MARAQNNPSQMSARRLARDETALDKKCLCVVKSADCGKRKLVDKCQTTRRGASRPGRWRYLEAYVDPHRSCGSLSGVITSWRTFPADFSDCFNGFFDAFVQFRPGT